MITTMCFSFCGYFYYPMIKNSLLISFIERICDINKTKFKTNVIKEQKENINHKLLFITGNYEVLNFDDLSCLKSESFSAESVCFREKNNLSSEILLSPIDDYGYELSFMIELDELEECDNKSEIVNEYTDVFFEIFNPVYGCCGVNMFVEPLDCINEDNFVKSKLYYAGYIGFANYTKFEFMNKLNNSKKFKVKILENGKVFYNNQGTVL